VRLTVAWLEGKHANVISVNNSSRGKKTLDGRVRPTKRGCRSVTWALGPSLSPLFFKTSSGLLSLWASAAVSLSRQFCARRRSLVQTEMAAHE
jgi:hypothetical protein